MSKASSHIFKSEEYYRLYEAAKEGREIDTSAQVVFEALDLEASDKAQEARTTKKVADFSRQGES